MLYCKECGKPNDLLSNFCSKCGNPFVSLGKTTPPKTKPKFVPRQAEKNIDDDDDEDIDDEGVIESEIPQIEGLEYEIEQPKVQTTTVADLLAAGGSSKPPRPIPEQPKMSARQQKAAIKQTIDAYRKEAGTLRPKK